ncbi:MAG: hypothetical protein EXS38_08970 [Opitutus sp.]|nr:hypothetical protein [Opitutus sp.]
MIRDLFHLLRAVPDPRRLVLFAGGALASGLIGFVLVPPSLGKTLIAAWGYYFILGLFGLFGFYAWRVASSRREVWAPVLRRPGLVGLMIAVGAAFVIWSDPFRHKILFDEYVLQATALHMHTTKEIGTVIRAYEIAGSWVPIDTFLDKRPYFFPFLVSLVHDFTGYRLANMFFVNAALAPCFLALVYWLGRSVVGRAPALLAVGLLATMPLLGQQASGAGMELHNLTMLALVMALAVLYLRAPDDDRLSLLVLGTVLLAQCRYESVVFVGVTAVVVLAGWGRAQRVILTWPAVIAPLLLVPYAWQARFVDASPLLWQLAEGQTSRFGLTYLGGNLEGAWTFFFNRSTTIANSWYLSVLGTAGLVGMLVRTWRWARRTARGEIPAPLFVLAGYGVFIAFNLGVLMFYYWSRLDDVMASRFALPMCLLLALFAALFVHGLEQRRIPVTRWAAAGLVVWVLGWGVPAMARRTYTNMNLVMQEVEWEHEELMRRPGPLLFITNKSTIPFVLWHVPTIITGVGRQRAEQIKYHLREGTFRDVIIAQALRPTTAEGDMGVDPEDLMPPNYRLETLAEKRFGGRWARLSRLVTIDAAPRVAAAAP